MSEQTTSAPATASDQQRIIFIRGIMPRSGTNYLSDALSHHASIVKAPRSFWEFAPFRYQPLLDDYLSQIAACKHAHDFCADEMLLEFGRAWTRYLGRQLERDKVMMLKEPSVDHLRRMLVMFPRAKSIIIVRDGRDVVESSLHAEFTFPKLQWYNPRHWRRLSPGGEFRILCRRYAEAAHKVVDLLETSGADDTRCRLVRYEDLVADSENTIKGILQWAGLSNDEFDWAAFAKMPVRGSSYLRNQDGSMNFAKGVQKPAGFAPLRRWQQWSSYRRSYFERVAGKDWRRLGYGSDEQPAGKQTLAE